MSVKVNYTSTGQPIPATNGIIGVPLPEANALLGVNQADTAYQGYTLIAGVGTNIVYSDEARTITFNSTGGGGGGTTTVSAGTGISVSHVDDDYQVSSTVVAPTVSAGTNVSVSHVGNDYTVSASGVQTITAGTNVTVSRVGDAVTINASGGGGGTLDSLTNVSIDPDTYVHANDGMPLVWHQPSAKWVSAGYNGHKMVLSDTKFFLDSGDGSEQLSRFNVQLNGAGTFSLPSASDETSSVARLLKTTSLVAGSNITLTVSNNSDVDNSVTISSSGGGGGTTYSPTASKGTGISSTGTVGIDHISADGKSFRLIIDSNDAGSNGTYIDIDMGATPPSGAWKVCMFPANEAARNATFFVAANQSGASWSPYTNTFLPSFTHFEWNVILSD